MKKKLYLNLGCGELPVKGAVNVDSYPSPFIDEVVDLTKLPWKWGSETVDGIYLIHVLEHFAEAVRLLKECHRILKKGGFLYIQVPHSSNVCAVGDISHYHTYSYPTINDLLTHTNWMIPTALFLKDFSRLIWWDTRHRPHPYLTFTHTDYVSKRPIFDRLVTIPLASVIQRCIDVSPSFFERIWGFYVGGADEVIWKGTKI